MPSIQQKVTCHTKNWKKSKHEWKKTINRCQHQDESDWNDPTTILKEPHENASEAIMNFLEKLIIWKIDISNVKGYLCKQIEVIEREPNGNYTTEKFNNQSENSLDRLNSRVEKTG